jgi:hypothetical protein
VQKKDGKMRKLALSQPVELKNEQKNEQKNSKNVEKMGPQTPKIEK